jgi:hypothetical protein
MKKHSFTEYSKKGCIQNNMIALISFAIITALIVFLLSTIPGKYASQPNNGFADLAAVIMILFSGFILMIITSLIIPLFISVYSEFKDNLKSLIVLLGYNLLVLVFLLAAIPNFIFIIIYFSLTILAPLGILYLRYKNIKKKLNNI